MNFLSNTTGLTDQERIEKAINKRPEPDRTISLQAFRRYQDEAGNKSYSSDISDLVAYIRDNRIFKDADIIYDLGAGPGQMVTALAEQYPDTMVQGIDLSVGFCSNFEAVNTLDNAKMNAALIDDPLVLAQNSGSISTLTLDRLTNPKQLIANMAQCERGRVLATLLPIVAEDDNPSLQAKKIIYTSLKDRITPGKKENEDRKILTKLLRGAWKTDDIRFDQVTYGVTSSGDTQQYKLGIFSTF